MEETALKSYQQVACGLFVTCLLLETEWASLLMFQQIALAGVLAFLLSTRHNQQDKPSSSSSSPELNLELDQELIEYMEANPFHECTANDTTIIDSSSAAQEPSFVIDTAATPAKKDTPSEDDNSLDDVILLLKRLTLDDRMLQSVKKELKQTPKKKQAFPIHLDDDNLAEETPQTRNAARTPFRDISRNNNNNVEFKSVFSKKSTSANFLVSNSRINLTGTSNTMTTPQKRAMKAVASTPIV